VKDTNIPDSNVLTNEVKINLSILGAVVLDEVGVEVEDVDVVTVDQGGPRRGCATQRVADEANTPPSHC
jgi:hypothetical protein